MQIPIRLYKRHDLDLIYLYNHKDFSLVKAMKLALYGYVNKEQFLIDTPKDDKGMFVYQNKDKKSIFFRLTFDPKKDKAICDFIEKMPAGYRNSMIKNLTRNYLNGANILGYYVDKKAAVNDVKNIKTLDIFEESKTYKNYSNSTHGKSTICSVYVPKKKTYISKKKLKDLNVKELQDEIFNHTQEELEEKYINPTPTPIPQKKSTAPVSFNDTNSEQNDDEEFDMFKQISEMMNI